MIQNDANAIGIIGKKSVGDCRFFLSEIDIEWR
jgi:hypothetical protein